MASNNSGPISPGSSYTLGEYVFTLQNVVSEDERIIQAHITGPEGSAAKGITVPLMAQLESWSVEANETEASVYALIAVPVGSDKKASPLVDGVVTIGTVTKHYTSYGADINYVFSGVAYLRGDPLYASNSPGDYVYTAIDNRTGTSTQHTGNISNVFTYSGKTVYYISVNTGGVPVSHPPESVGEKAKVAWTMVYGTPVEPEEYEKQEALIGRFSIDLKEADGGPDGGWDEPGSVEPDPEPGEPEQMHTLTLTAIAALSGRHNDPLNDTSYSYLPADNTTVKPYGCGGDGGHGGGGGGGASTMVVRKIVTDKASHTEIVAHTKRHGYGSGGGKGGKGGDGCIMIFW